MATAIKLADALFERTERLAAWPARKNTALPNCLSVE